MLFNTSWGKKVFKKVGLEVRKKRYSHNEIAKKIIAGNVENRIKNNLNLGRALFIR